ncbi:hypothetical protein [Undibacterium umbellatum]|uniref:Uncharacterized protein n=1 Tax=Undibacterium umbellatum TaxID=2762300 RepID=A0ABR6Z9C6_9BURK|nr:hypothetical protein [Undibacterium umbellatum]MBC3908374.1 hypothetical protein [Undibacterium umbellatum]
MDFESVFKTWLGLSLAEATSLEIKAYSFNLFENAKNQNSKFGIELIGAGSFDSADTDWACDEVWQPETRAIDIPFSFSGPEWETCLSRIEILISAYLTDEMEAKVLLDSRAVGVGFVDGDLSLLWQSQ